MIYPRVLIIAIGRINAADTDNNGLVLRGLFGNWPRENIGQIFSSGNNGDKGFFAHYYCLSGKDRLLGNLFYKLKNEKLDEISRPNNYVSSVGTNKLFGKLILTWGKNLLIDSGLYELIFRPIISFEMQDWINKFQPDIIFSQGYNLAFTWLPMMVAKSFSIPIIFYPGDDWPANRYLPEFSNSFLVSRLARHAIKTSSRKLIQMSAVRFANSRYMMEEYLKRYGKEFTVLMMGDDFNRTESISPLRLAEPSTCWVVSTGTFDQHRFPLLEDLNHACEILHRRGHNVKATVFLVNSVSELNVYANSLPYIDFQTCPSHDGLMAVLRGADILFLPERFDKTTKFIQISISTKAHLFMFTGKPIIVYSDPETGITRYAREEGWAAVVDRRDPLLLAQTLERLISDEVERKRLIANARGVAIKNHDLTRIQSSFYDLLYSAFSK